MTLRLTPEHDVKQVSDVKRIPGAEIGGPITRYEVEGVVFSLLIMNCSFLPRKSSPRLTGRAKLNVMKSFLM